MRTNGFVAVVTIFLLFFFPLADGVTVRENRPAWIFCGSPLLSTADTNLIETIWAACGLGRTVGRDYIGQHGFG